MIKKEWRARKGRDVWGYDIWVAVPGKKKKQRLRVFDFDTKDEAIEALGVLLGKVKASKHGLSLPADEPLLVELIRARLGTVTKPSEKTRETRVLIEWLALLDPTVDASERDVAKVFSKWQIRSIGTPEIRLYAKKRADDGQSPASIKRELVIIAAMLHQAPEFFPELAQWRPPKIPYPKVKNSRRERVLTDDEYQKLVKCLTRPPSALDGNRKQNQRNGYEARIRVADILQFAMLTGARHSEIMKLQWKDVSWAQGRILIYQGKTDRYKQIPLTEPLQLILKSRQKEGDRPLAYVFSKGGNINPKFYRILREACELCEIPYGQRNPDGIVLHTARHTVTTRLVNAGLDFDTIGQITGHSAKELILHYTHHTPGSMQRAAAALGEVGQIKDRKENP